MLLPLNNVRSGTCIGRLGECVVLILSSSKKRSMGRRMVLLVLVFLIVGPAGLLTAVVDEGAKPR